MSEDKVKEAIVAGYRRAAEGNPKTLEMLQEFRGENGDGRDLLRRREFDKALAYFNDRLAQYPRSAYYAEGKAMALTELGEFKEAIKCYDSIIQSFDEYLTKYWPTSADLLDITYRSLNNKAWLFDKLGRWEEIEPCYRKAMQCVDSLSRLSAKGTYLSEHRLLLYKARIHAVLQENEQALECLKLANEQNRKFSKEVYREFREHVQNMPEFETLKNSASFRAIFDSST
jgi:tetratricopeptide (TPR) repeat protein